MFCFDIDQKNYDFFVELNFPFFVHKLFIDHFLRVFIPSYFTGASIIKNFRGCLISRKIKVRGVNYLIHISLLPEESCMEIIV